ncbi:MAG: fibronectin type III domain-containing protein [Candidatus Moranbacteria bacterium]|nr:fibronectin type III domain-containing protein [Candidatus Moranbacteria bacterium]MDD3965044.1 fibronectin type III domain-containing protein [Candidatus Moranbacteria bacterium]
MKHSYFKIFIFLSLFLGVAIDPVPALASKTSGSVTIPGTTINTGTVVGAAPQGVCFSFNLAGSLMHRASLYDNGTEITDGASITSGHILSLAPITNNADIQWFATGSTWNSPSGHWVSGAGFGGFDVLEPVMDCNDINDYDTLALGLSIAPPSPTYSFSGPCTPSGSTCTVNGSGTITATINFRATPYSYYYQTGWSGDSFTSGSLFASGQASAASVSFSVTASAPATCPAYSGTDNLTPTCVYNLNAPVTSSGSSYTSTSVASPAGYTGSRRWNCNNGTWTQGVYTCTPPTPVNCVGSWSDTATCSVTGACGQTGVKQQLYTIYTPAANGGTACPFVNGATRWGATSCSTATCPVPTYSCTGIVPTNATMFANDDVSLNADTPYSYWATDTGTRCQYSCNGGYNWNGSSCVAVLPAPATVSVSAGDCQSDTLTALWSPVTGATGYDIQIDGGTWIQRGYYATGYTFRKLIPESSHVVSVRARNIAGPGPEKVATPSPVIVGRRPGNQCETKICQGSVPVNATMFANDNVNLTADTPYSYWATDTGTRCQYSCNGGYNWNGSSCVLPPTPTYSCTGTIPANASMFVSDNVGLSANTPYAYSATNTAPRCQFSCNGGFTWSGGSCVAPTYSCTSFPSHAMAWNSLTPGANTPYTYSATDPGSVACKFQCASGYTWNGSTCGFVSPACTPSCDRGNSFCTGKTYDDSNGCGTNNCNGTRYCDFNWKETVPF